MDHRRHGGRHAAARRCLAGVAVVVRRGVHAARGELLFRAATDLGEELWKIAIPAASACAGDCDGDGATTITELTLGVSVVIGARPSSACTALDADGDGRPTVADLVSAVAAALSGCPVD